MGAITHNGEVLQRLPANASQINFDKTGTNLNSTQTEAAIKEVNTKVNANTDDITQLKSGLIGIGTELNNTSYSGIKYISIGRLKIVFISGQELTDGDTLGLPAGTNNSVVLLRDETVGGCVQVVVNNLQTISADAGHVNFVSGHAYSGYYTYISVS